MGGGGGGAQHNVSINPIPHQQPQHKYSSLETRFPFHFLLLLLALRKSFIPECAGVTRDKITKITKRLLLCRYLSSRIQPSLQARASNPSRGRPCNYQQEDSVVMVTNNKLDLLVSVTAQKRYRIAGLFSSQTFFANHSFGCFAETFSWITCTHE